MKKEELLKIIIQDIRDLELFATTFLKMDGIPESLIKIAKSKVSGISSELELLEELEKSTVIIRPNAPTPSPGGVKYSSTSQVFIVDEVEPKTVVVEKKDDPIIAVPAPSQEPVVKKMKEVEIEIEPPVAVPSLKEVEVQTHAQGNGKAQVILGEVLGGDKPSYNDVLAKSHKPGLPTGLKKPVKDLTKAIGINDRFLFQRELFGDNADLLNQTIAQVNQMASLEEAENFISANFNWDQNNSTVIAFNQLIGRRFI